MSWIAHICFDSLLATIEQNLDPKLRDYPVVVCDNPHTIVLDASIQAKKFGIKNGMPIATAKKLCTNLKTIQPKSNLYKQIINEIPLALSKISNKLEVNDLDKYNLDITDSIISYESAKNKLLEMHKFIKTKTNLHFTICIAPNKFVATVVANKIKPNGLQLITPENVYNSICDLPAAVLVNNNSEVSQLFRKLNISKIKDIHRFSQEFWENSLGKIGEEIYKRSFGIDDSKIKPNFIATNFSVIEKLPKPISNIKILLIWLLSAVKKASESLQQTKQKIELMQVTFITKDNQQIKFLIEFFPPTNQPDIIFIKTKHIFIQNSNLNNKEIVAIQLDSLKTALTSEIR